VAEAVAVAEQLQARGHRVTLDVVGDGPERDVLDRAGVEVTAHGWLDGAGVRRVLATSHVLLVPSRTEGWPKVVSEALAYGVVPVAPDISAIAEVLAGCGVVATDRRPEAFVEALEPLLADLEPLRRAGLERAERFTFDAYLAAVDDLFAERWGLTLVGRP